MGANDTWLDRLERAWPEVVDTYDTTRGPIVCLGKLLGYEECLRLGDDDWGCLKCWHTPVSELRPFVEKGE